MVTWLFFVVRVSNIDVQQNHLGDLLNRIAGSHFQNFWLNSSEVRSTNLLFWQVPGWCWCCWSGSRLGEPLPWSVLCCLALETARQAAFLVSSCLPEPPLSNSEFPLGQMLWLCTPRLCTLFRFFLHLYNREIGPNPQTYQIRIQNFCGWGLGTCILTNAQGLLILLRVWESQN